MTLATLAPPDSGTRTRAKTPRTLLVNPSAGGAFRTLSLQMPPLGILCVASYVEKLGFPVDVVDRCVAGWREPLRLDGYDVVGIHADTTRYYRALEIAAQAKAAGAIVVMGGPHPCYVEEEVLGTGVVDYIVRGEGEVIFGNLLQALRDGSPVSKVRGITYRENGRIVRTPPEWAITDLDTLPMPAREKVPMDRYLRTRLGGRPITRKSLHRLFREAEKDELQPLTFLDLDWNLVNRVLEREKQQRRSGPIAENILRELGTVAARIG